MDAKKISYALGGMTVGKPPIARATAGALPDVALRHTVRLEDNERADKAGFLPSFHDFPSSHDFPTPRENGRSPM